MRKWTKQHGIYVSNVIAARMLHTNNLTFQSCPSISYYFNWRLEQLIAIYPSSHIPSYLWAAINCFAMFCSFSLCSTSMYCIPFRSLEYLSIFSFLRLVSFATYVDLPLARKWEKIFPFKLLRLKLNRTAQHPDGLWANTIRRGYIATSIWGIVFCRW